MEHADWTKIYPYLVWTLTAIIGLGIVLAYSGKKLHIRRLPAIDAIEEAVGRATEMGRPMLFVPGLADVNVVTFQAISIAAHIARLAARYRSRIIMPITNTVILTMAEQVLKEAYAEGGSPDAFRPEDIRFLSGEQFAFASGVVGLMNRERVAANFFFGDFAAESLILAETGQSLGAIQIAGTPSTLQIPFFIAACDFTVIGEEYYAVTAYLTREPILLGSVWGQDICRIILAAIIFATTVLQRFLTPIVLKFLKM
ncbi:MAG: DUF6754 domain-containing protein [Candidatus Fervidibacter sp.]|uniref:DUF6754 domain-containing protein n=1 Tax=Candidatus Fervidibacter sp. TaxID=3100871 RepID=UPI0040499327